MSAAKTKLSSRGSKGAVQSCHGNETEENRGLGTRRITQEANFLVTEKTGQYSTTEGNSEKGTIVNIKEML